MMAAPIRGGDGRAHALFDQVERFREAKRASAGSSTGGALRTRGAPPSLPVTILRVGALAPSVLRRLVPAAILGGAMLSAEPARADGRAELEKARASFLARNW